MDKLVKVESAMAIERAHLSEVQEELASLYAKQEHLKKETETDHWTASENRHLYISKLVSELRRIESHRLSERDRFEAQYRPIQKEMERIQQEIRNVDEKVEDSVHEKSRALRRMEAARKSELDVHGLLSPKHFQENNKRFFDENAQPVQPPTGYKI